MQNKEKINILLVDDRPENLFVLEATLESSDYNLVAAHSGLEALSLIEQYTFALILLDIQMPEMDGFETATLIKAKDGNIPIIFISAIYKEDPHVRRGYEVGASDYFGKPFDPDILKRKVGVYADLHRKNLKLQHSEEQLRMRNREIGHHAAELTTVMDAVPEVIYVVSDDRITRNNSAALAVFGFEAPEDMRQDLESFSQQVHIRDAKTGVPLPLEDEPGYRALKGEKSSRRVVVRNLRTGKDKVVNATAIPMYFKDEIIGAVVTHVPLTVVKPVSK